MIMNGAAEIYIFSIILSVFFRADSTLDLLLPTLA